MIRSFVIVCFLFLSTYVLGGEYIIKTREGLKSNVLDSFFLGKNSGLKKEIKRWNDLSMRFVLLDDKNLETLKNNYSGIIEYIEPNFKYHTMAIPTVPSTQWGLKTIEVSKAWTISQGNKDIIVSIIDTGIDCTHDALKDHCLSGWNFVTNTKDGIDDHGHGTHCAGNIAANSKIAMGVAPNVTVLAVKFLDAEGGGTLEGAISAIKYSVDQGAKILSNSWGGGDYSEALLDAIKYAEDKGVLFIAAAGNESNDNDAQPSYPASYNEPNIISVAACDKSNAITYFSNYGTKSVHLCAPGMNILSTMPNNKTGSMSGTSMATPFVSGVAALVLSQNSNITFQEIKDKILDNVKKVDGLQDKVFTGGMLNAYQSIK